MKKRFLLLIVAVGLSLPFSCSNNSNPTAPAPTATFTPTNWAGYTNTSTPTSTPTATPTSTNVNGYTSTFTPTSTPTSTNVNGYTSTFTFTPTNTPTLTATNTPTDTVTSTATATPTNTLPLSPTPTWVQSGPGVQYPNGVAVNSSGTALYVAEGDGVSTNNQVQIFSVNGSNYSLLNTLTAYGPTAFVSPNGVALNSAVTTFYVVDAGNAVFNGAVYGFTSSGSTVVSWSSWTGGAVTSFMNPEGIAMDNSTNCGGGPCFYVADTGNNTVEEFAANGSPVTQWSFGTAVFDIPSAVAVNSTGTTLYVANAGDGLVQIFNGTTWSNGPMVANSDLFGIAADASGNIYLADAGNALVEEYNGTNLVTEWNGSPGPLFLSPDGIAITNSGAIWVTDWNNGPSNTGTLSEF